MISNNMRFYDYFALGEENAYGQQKLSTSPVGQIKMAIETTSQSIQDNILYNNASYVGFTFGDINDTHVISYGDKKLKVLYVNSRGRMKQVFMATYGNN